MVDVVIKSADGPAADVIRGKLQTKSVIETQLENVSDVSGLSFSWTSTLTTGDTVIECITIQNDAVDKHLHIDQIWLGAVDLAVFAWGKVTSGTPAGTTIVGQPLNLDLSKVAEATAFGNASVTGTVVVANNAWLQVPADQTLIFDLEGAWILGKDDKFGIRCDTNTTVYITVIGHYDFTD
jgi:hypothetical protein